MRGAALGALLLLAAGAAAAQGPPAPQPPAPTVGSLGLLLAHPDRPETVPAIALGLASGDRDVRAAAAHVAWMLAPRSLEPDLTRALASETDLTAASEEVEALALIGGAGAEPALLQAAERLKPRLASAVGVAVARTRRAAALDLLPKLRPLGLTTPVAVLHTVAAAEPGRLVPLAVAAVRDQDAPLWEAVLDSCPAGCAAIDGMVKASVTSPDEKLRVSTYRHLTARAKAGPLDGALSSAIAAAAEASGDTSGDGPAAQAYDLLRRAQGALPRLKSTADATMPVAPRPLGAGEGTMRTAEYPPAFVGGVLAASGCKPKAVLNPAAQVTFRPDGRPAKIEVFAGLIDPKCVDAATALFAASAAPLERPPDTATPDVVVLRWDEASIACVDARMAEIPSAVLDALSATGGVKEPRKLKDVPPKYPDWALKQGLQGAVIIQALIGTSGCVRAMRVLDGRPGLAAAGMAAVGQWRYTPTLLNGVPVPVMMTVTVNFRLAY